MLVDASLRARDLPAVALPCPGPPARAGRSQPTKRVCHSPTGSLQRAHHITVVPNICSLVDLPTRSDPGGRQQLKPADITRLLTFILSCRRATEPTPQEVQGRDRRKLADALPVAWQAELDRVGNRTQAEQARRRRCRPGRPSCSLGPATPVVARPTSAPRTRRAPSAIAAAASRVTTGPSATPEHRSLDVRCRRPRRRLGTTRSRRAQPTTRAARIPPVRDSTTPRLHPRPSSSRPTAPSIVSSSTPKTESPRSASELGFLGIERLVRAPCHRQPSR